MAAIRPLIIDDLGRVNCTSLRGCKPPRGLIITAHCRKFEDDGFKDNWINFNQGFEKEYDRFNVPKNLENVIEALDYMYLKLF